MKNLVLWFIYFLILIPFGTVISQASHIVEKVELKEYPIVQIFIQEGAKDPLKGNNLRISEWKEKKQINIKSVDIIRNTKDRKIKLLLAIQSSRDMEKLDNSKEIAKWMLEQLKEDDSVGTHLFSKNSLSFDFTINKKDAMNNIDAIRLDAGTNLNRNLSYLFDQYARHKISIPTNIFVINQEDKSKSDLSIDLVVSKALENKQFLNVIGSENEMNKNLAKSTGGKFYSIHDQKLFSKLLYNLEKFRKPPLIIEYESPHYSFVNVFYPNKIQIDLIIDNKEFNLSYEMNFSKYFKLKFWDIKIFYLVTFSLLLLLLYAYFGIIKENKRRNKEIAEKLEFLKYKDDLYHKENMYSMQVQQAKLHTEEDEGDSEEVDIDLDSDGYFEEELPNHYFENAREYSQAILIQKKGPNPGRQFVMNQEEIKIGSSENRELVLLNSNLKPYHAKIKKIRNIYFLFHIKNSPTFLNGQQLDGPKPLNNQDIIGLGDALLIFRGK